MDADGSQPASPLGSLDYVYAPSADVPADVGWFVEVLGAEVAYLRARGWSAERQLELPMGAAATFRSPGGLRLAIYEASRPFVVDGFAGRRDF